MARFFKLKTTALMGNKATFAYFAPGNFWYSSMLQEAIPAILRYRTGCKRMLPV
jgi:hypothetical protein